MSSIQLDKNTAGDHLHKTPFQIKHKLINHPLFTLPKLVELAQLMPRDKIEFNGGDLEVGQTPETTPKLDMAPQDVINPRPGQFPERAIKRVEAIPQYNALLTEFVDDLLAASDKAGQK